MNESILVVDDDQNLRWVTQTQLEDAGYRVTTVPNGEAALDASGQTSPVARID